MCKARRLQPLRITRLIWVSRIEVAEYILSVTKLVAIRIVLLAVRLLLVLLSDPEL